MVRMMCVILSLAFLTMGITGITGLLPVFRSYPAYVNSGEIILGALGLLVGIYARQAGEGIRQRRENSQQRKENVQLRKAQFDQLVKENERLIKENEQQRKEAGRLFPAPTCETIKTAK